MGMHVQQVSCVALEVKKMRKPFLKARWCFLIGILDSWDLCLMTWWNFFHLSWKVQLTAEECLKSRVTFSFSSNISFLAFTPNSLVYKHVAGLLKYALEFYCKEILGVLSAFGISAKCLNLPEDRQEFVRVIKRCVILDFLNVVIVK